MKTKLLLLLFLLSFLGFSQTINNFNSTDGSIYAVVSADASFDPGADPVLGVWNFVLTAVTTSSDSYSVPTSGEIASYPGSTLLQTTTVVTGVSTSETVETFTKDNSGEVSVTAIESSELDLVLNYNSDNALVGTFPFTSTSPISDPISGVASFDGTSLSFSGIAEAHIDNTGTLVMTVDGSETYNRDVTRLKVFQSMSLVLGGILTIGTATQTSYFYYDNITNDLVYRSTDTYIDITAIDPQTVETSVMESIISSSTLGVEKNNELEFSLSISPNPVKNILNLNVNANIETISIFDITGRDVMKLNTTDKSFSIDQLKTGLYIVRLVTDRGSVSRKFIKE